METKAILKPWDLNIIDDGKMCTVGNVFRFLTFLIGCMKEFSPLKLQRPLLVTLKGVIIHHFTALSHKPILPKRGHL